MLRVVNKKKYLETKEVLEGDFSNNINNFFKDSSIYISGIKRGIECEDFLKIQSLACTIKNVADEFGAEIASDLAKKIENQANSIMTDEGGDIEDIRNLFIKLESSLYVSQEELKKLLK